jgi:hypothetical protein
MTESLLQRVELLSRPSVPRQVVGAARTALTLLLQLRAELVYVNVASIGAVVGLLASSRMRRVSAAAVQALGGRPSRRSVWQFARDWWYLAVADRVVAYQLDRVSEAWALEHVQVTDALPDGGCILLSVHHFSQRFSLARLSALVDRLGLVTLYAPLPADDPALAHSNGVHAARSRAARRAFGDRIFLPPYGYRGAVDLLRSGGSVIVISDLNGSGTTRLLGRQLPMPRGAAWLACQSGRPIVPFMLLGPRRSQPEWRLWFGAPIAPTEDAVIAALEECIRRAPPAWMGWPIWHEAPPCAA